VFSFSASFDNNDSFFTNEQLKENIIAMIDAIMKVKPSAAKGRYLRSASIACTMGPGIKLDTQSLINLIEG
jgi:large subunit ribosomal protein L1